LEIRLSAEDPLNLIRRARQSGRHDIAIDTIRRLVGSGARLGRGWQEVLNHALALADEDGALEVAKALQREHPDEPQVMLILAERFSRVGQSDVALQLVEQLKQTSPPNPALDYFRSVYSGHVGKLDQSAQSAREALKQKPDFGDAWALLASTGHLNASDRMALERLVDTPAAHALPGAAYALGALNHREGQHDQAWAAWTKANQFEQQKRTYDRKGDLAMMKDVQAAFAKLADTLPTPSNSPEAPRPVFVVGAPRSGTSLTEQIIATAPSVRAIGETMFSRTATWSLGNLTQADIQRAGGFETGKINWRLMGMVYRKLAEVRAQGAPVITDKGAILHLFAGAMAYSLPDAKIVWVRRDKRDIMLSAWRTYFTSGTRWRHNLSDAVAFLTAHEDMMDYWQSVMPDRVHRLDYEALVTQPQAETDRLMAFLGLPAPNLETTSFTASNVPTASFAQIRSRITPKSVGGWKTYETFMRPAIDDLD
jgi:tetratricopeptide (TPR) repeat protein